MKILSKYIIGTMLFSIYVQQSFAQESIDSTDKHELSMLLTHYYNIKDALVAGNGNQAAQYADAFIRTANTIDYKVISEGNINALLKDATAVSASKDIKVQRSHFAGLSDNMAILAKTLQLGDAPVYKAYCPMKKASWLSNDKAIKNPYYGNMMLTCGSVVETYNQ